LHLFRVLVRKGLGAATEISPSLRIPRCDGGRRCRPPEKEVTRVLSLTLCLNKAHLEPDAVNAHVTARMARNESGRLQIEGIDVELTPCFSTADHGRFDRCQALYEDFCIVTESVRRGIPVNVRIARCGEDAKRVA
jgi:hypothetical protein